MNVTIDVSGSTWTKKGEKEGGARPSGEFGGVYETEENGEKKQALIKKDNPPQDIAEFLGTRIHQKSVPDHSPELFIKKLSSSNDRSGDGEVYLGSVFFKNYKDLYKDIYSEANREIPNDRPRMVGSVGSGKDLFRDGLKNNGYKGFPEVMATSLLIGDFDIHWGNIGVVRDEGKDPKLVRIDFGAAFNNLTEEIKPHSIAQHLPGFGPTNHFREFPREMKLNEQFINELARVSQIDFKEIISSSFKELKSVYSEKDIKGFAQRLGIAASTIEEEKTFELIQEKLISLMQKRQESLKDFATELSIDLCITKNEENKWALNHEKFEKVVKSNPKYFEDVSKGVKKITFYDLNHRDTWNPFSSNPDARSLTRVFSAMAHAINKVLQHLNIAIPTTETQLTKMIEKNVQIEKPSKEYQPQGSKPKSFLEHLRRESQNANTSSPSRG